MAKKFLEIFSFFFFTIILYQNLQTISYFLKTDSEETPV